MEKVISTFIAISLFIVPLNAAADNLLWSYSGCNGVYNSADLGDINSDGIPDVVCGKYYSDDGDELFALSGADGTEIWDSNDCLGIWGTKSLETVPDLNGDGIREVIMGTPGGVSEGRSFYLKSGVDGTTIFSYSTYSGPNAGWVHAVAGIEDVNNNGKADLLAGAGGQSGDYRGTIFCFDGGSTSGSVNIIWSFRPQYDGVQCLTVIGDVTGDGIDEVVFGSGGNGYDNQVYCLNGATGIQEWKTPDTGDSLWDVINVGDLDDDGYDDVAAGNWDGEVIAFSGLDGSQIWSEAITTVVMDLERIPDVDGDGYDDMVVGHWGNSLFCVSGADGSVIWAESIASNLWNVDVVEDFTGDGLWEAVGGALATGSGSVKVCSGDNGDELWSESYSERIYDVETVGDMNDDGISEVCVCLQDHAHETAHVFLYDVADGYIGIDDEDNGNPYVPTSFVLHQSRPNPCSGTAMISFVLPKTAAATLSVYDIKGRRLATPLEETLDAGEHEVTVSGLSPGIYLYKLEAGENEAERKMVVK